MPRDKKTVIVHLTGNLLVGGAEKQLTLFCRSMDHARFSQFVLCMRGGGPLEEQLNEAGVPVIHLRKNAKLDLFFFVRLLKTLAVLKPDIVHCWLFSANLWGRLACLFFPKIKVIATERVEGDWKAWYHRLVDKILLAFRTDLLLANSNGVIAYFHEKEKLPLDKVRLVFNAIDVKERTRSINKERGVKRVITMSRLTYQKGIDCFINAAERVIAQRSNIVFDIYGEGEKRKEYEKLVRDKGLEDKIHFKGKERVFKIMRDADIYVSASRFEGLPNAIMEAMAYGMPIVATNIGGTNELIEHEKTGLLAKKENVEELAMHIIRLINDPDGGERLGFAARKFIHQRFLITNVVKELEAVYDDLV